LLGDRDKGSFQYELEKKKGKTLIEITRQSNQMDEQFE